MRIMRRWALLALCIGLSFAGTGVAQGRDGQVTVLTLTRLSSQLLPIVERLNRETVSMGGLVHAASLIHHIRADEPDAVLIVGGESVLGPQWRYFKGEPEFKALSKLDVSAGIIGKHELDYGWEHLEAALPWIEFPLVLSNVDVHGVASPFRKNVVIPCGEMRLGVFGLFSPVIFATQQKPVEEIALDGDLHGVARAMVEDLRAQSADVILMISGLTAEENEALARDVAGIHAIFGRGVEAKEPLAPHFVEGPDRWITALVWGGERGRIVGRLDLATRGGRIYEATVSWRPLPVSPSVGRADDAVSAIAADYAARLNEQLGRPIGWFERPVNARRNAVRTRETPLGSFAADAMRAIGGADVGLVNGGAIRGDKLYPEGEFSERTIIENFPYGNEVDVVTVTGRALREVMELSASALRGDDDGYEASARVPDGGFLQVSGLRVVYDISQPPTTFKEDGTVDHWGSRLVELSVMGSDGAWGPVDDDAEYSVALSAYLADGGDRYFPLKDARDRKKTGRRDAEALLAYIQEFPDGRLSLETEGRIVIRR